MKAKLQLRAIQSGSFLILIIMLFDFSACSSSTEEIKNNSVEKRKGEKTFSFYEDDPAAAGVKEVYREVNFNGDSISSVYKNGEKISPVEIEKNKAKIFDKIDGLRESKKEFSVWHKHHPKDLKLFKGKMKDFQGEINRKFNDSLFRDNMKKLNEELANIKVPKIDMKKFQIEIDSLNDRIKDFDFEFNHEFDFDMKEFDKNMKAFADGMNEFNFDFDFPNFDLHNFNLQMDDLDNEIDNLNMEMEKLDNFLTELKTELVKDKILKNKDEKYEAEFESGKIVINGKGLPDKLFQKYKRMYKEYFGKELDREFQIIE